MPVTAVDFHEASQSDGFIVVAHTGRDAVDL